MSWAIYCIIFSSLSFVFSSSLQVLLNIQTHKKRESRLEKGTIFNTFMVWQNIFCVLCESSAFWFVESHLRWSAYEFTRDFFFMKASYCRHNFLFYLFLNFARFFFAGKVCKWKHTVKLKHNAETKFSNWQVLNESFWSFEVWKIHVEDSRMKVQKPFRKELQQGGDSVRTLESSRETSKLRSF